MTGAELKQKREDLEVTPPEFAERLGVPTAQLTLWERSEMACPDFPLIFDLAVAQLIDEIECERLPDDVRELANAPFDYEQSQLQSAELQSAITEAEQFLTESRLRMNIAD